MFLLCLFLMKIFFIIRISVKAGLHYQILCNHSWNYAYSLGKFYRLKDFKKCLRRLSDHVHA